MIRSFAFVAVASVGASISLTAQAPADPWQRIPAFPTSCLADGFPAAVEALRTTLHGEIEKQKEVNDSLQLQFNNMDMQEKMRRMQAFMAKNPQEAMKVMQALQGNAAATTSGITSAEADKTALDAQLADLTTAFRQAADASAKPIRARQSQMIGAKAEPYAGGNRFKSKADQDAFMELLKQEDAAYESVCAPYFGAGGKFHAWLNEYRTRVSAKLAAANEANDATIITQMSMLDSPGQGYRSTAKLAATHEYLARVGEVFELRYGKARPPLDLILIK